METSKIKFPAMTWSDDNTVVTVHKAVTAKGDKIHKAHKYVKLEATEDRPAGWEHVTMDCGTAITYRFTIASHEMTEDEYEQITCTKCKPSLRKQVAS